MFCTILTSVLTPRPDKLPKRKTIFYLGEFFISEQQICWWFSSDDRFDDNFDNKGSSCCRLRLASSTACSMSLYCACSCSTASYAQVLSAVEFLLVSLRSSASFELIPPLWISRYKFSRLQANTITWYEFWKDSAIRRA